MSLEKLKSLEIGRGASKQKITKSKSPSKKKAQAKNRQSNNLLKPVSKAKERQPQTTSTVSFYPDDVEALDQLEQSLKGHGLKLSRSQIVRLALRMLEIDSRSLNEAQAIKRQAGAHMARK